MLVFFGVLFIVFLPFLNEAFVAIFQRNPLGIEAMGKWIGLTIVVIAVFPFIFALAAFKSKGIDRVVTSGIFKYVRHPMRLAMLILAFGLMVWRLSIALIIAYLVLVVCTSIASGREEKILLEKFGDEYREYAEGAKSKHNKRNYKVAQDQGNQG